MKNTIFETAIRFKVYEVIYNGESWNFGMGLSLGTLQNRLVNEANQIWLSLDVFTQRDLRG